MPPPEIIIELSQPSDTEIEEPDAVELRTVEVATSILRPATWLAEPLPPVAGSVLALVAERWEGPFRTRDVCPAGRVSGSLVASGARTGIPVNNHNGHRSRCACRPAVKGRARADRRMVAAKAGAAAVRDAAALRPAGDSLAVPDRPVPAAAASPPDAVRLVRLGTHLVALTPVGQFLMTARSCQETWLTEAADGLVSHLVEAV